jgi:hypothetical protein
MWKSVRGLVTVSGVVTVLAVGLGAAVPAAGAARPASFLGAAELAGVSCPKSSWCMAVGSYTTRSQVQHSLAQIWNGHSWRVIKPPGSALTGVSCTSTRFCLATGGPTRAERWNGTTWREIPGPQNPANAGVQNLAGGITCGSESMCLVINGTKRGGSANAAETWNGHRWRTWWQDTNLCTLSDIPGSPCALSGISCGTATNCVAVGDYTSASPGFSTGVPTPGAFTWNGQHWAPATTGYQNVLGSNMAGNGIVSAFNVSCSGTFCLSMAGSQDSANSLAATWQASSQSWSALPGGGFSCPDGYGGCYYVSSMSCASRTSCMVFVTVVPSGEAVWNGTTWTNVNSIGEGQQSLLADVSCRGTICLAVGHHANNPHRIERTLAELWNGATWTVIPTPNLT